MGRWVVEATPNESGGWTLEQRELGAVSEVSDLADSVDEMVEAVAYLSGERMEEVELDVRQVGGHRLGINTDDDRQIVELALSYADQYRDLTRARWPGPERSEAARLDASVESLWSVTQTLVATQKTARACVLFLAELIKMDIQPRASIAVVLCRSALVSAARIIYVLGSPDPEERANRARQVLRRQSGSWYSAIEQFSDFQELDVLKPPSTLLDTISADREALSTRQINDGSLITASARTMAAQLEQRGMIPAGESDVVREHLTWMWHVWSGEAHGWAWVDGVPGHGDTEDKRPPGHWPSDFLMLTRLVHIALVLLNEAVATGEED